MAEFLAQTVQADGREILRHVQAAGNVPHAVKIPVAADEEAPIPR